MKKLLILALFVGLLASCTTTPEYIAKDKDGNPILIKDREGVIADAIKLNVDSIYVKEFENDGFFTPLRDMGEDETVFRVDSINGERVSWYVTYRVIHMSNLAER